MRFIMEIFTFFRILFENLFILFENQIQTTLASSCRTQVQPAASFLVSSMIFIGFAKFLYSPKSRVCFMRPMYELG